MQYHGNQLIRADDYANNYNIEPVGNADFKENYQPLPSGQTSEYLYNRNGSLKADHHKKIAWVQYNSLNLPSKIQMSNGDKTEYLYDASGVKLQSKHIIALNSMQIPLGDETLENTNNIHSSITRDYLGEFIFENGSPKRILMPDGYIEVTGTVAITGGTTLCILQ